MERIFAYINIQPFLKSEHCPRAPTHISEMYKIVMKE